MSQSEQVSGDLFGGIPNPASSQFLEICRFCDAHAAAVNASLPWLAGELGHNDGYATMLRVVRAWSGMRVYVSKDHERFLAKIGFPLSLATHRRFLLEVSSNSQIDVPSAWGVFLALRRAAIALAIRSRLPHDEISRRFGVTMRSLR